MKKLLFFLLIVVGLSPLAMAQPQFDDASGNRGALRVGVSDNSPIKVEIDNRLFTKHGKSLLVGDLPKGRHYLRIFEYKEYREHRGHLIYEGFVRVHKHAVTRVMFDFNTGYLEQHVDEVAAEPPLNNGSIATDAPHQLQGHTVNSNTPASVKDYPPVPDSYSEITAENISSLEQKVKDKITDTDKLKVLQSSLKKKAFNTDQLALIMGWLTFEQSKLELAKWAFAHTTDKNNFSKLEQSVFSENSNRNELDSYINAQTQH